MKAMILRDGELRVDAFPDLEPGPGQVLVRTLACGICASDLHLKDHGQNLAAWARENGGPFRNLDIHRDLVMGHEFCGEIEGYGPETRRESPTGSRVTSVGILLHGAGMSVLGYDNQYPGGFAEQMLLSEALIHPVPGDLPTDVAALAEPLSVGFQYARIARPQAGDVPLVIGCGAIGLSLIAALRRAGVGPILASDFSPHRRDLALRTGADEVFDPAEGSPFAAWKRLAKTRKNAVALIFECVGAPGVLGQLFDAAPFGARIIVAGVCLEPDRLFLAGAHSKGLNVQLGGMPAPEDFSGALRALAEGEIDVSSWITGHASLVESVDAFEQAKDATRHTRFMIHPAEVG